MGYTIDVVSIHGPPPAGAIQTIITKGQARFKLADNDTADVANPLTIPSTGSKFSWRKHTKLKLVSVLSGGGLLKDLVWYADKAPADWNQSLNMYVGLTTTYVQASSADEAGQVIGTTDTANYEPSTPLIVVSGNFITAGSPNPSFGNQPYVVQQMAVLSTSTSGIKTARSCGYRFTEV